jgi:hypothetical protein
MYIVHNKYQEIMERKGNVIFIKCYQMRIKKLFSTRRGHMLVSTTADQIRTGTGFYTMF